MQGLAFMIKKKNIVFGHEVMNKITLILGDLISDARKAESLLLMNRVIQLKTMPFEVRIVDETLSSDWIKERVHPTT